MPVKRTSCEVVRSSNFGGSRWMGSEPSRSSPDIPSMVLPTTFITRPRICAPTGIVMVLSVHRTVMPRRRPSVESIATVRTVSSPMCCCTSMMRGVPSLRVIWRASWIEGRRACWSSERSKWTSTTGPMIWEMRPVSAAILCCLAWVQIIYKFKHFRRRLQI